MKKLLVSVLAIVSMAACMNDEIVSVQKGNPIAFDSFVENSTRVGDPTINNGDLTGFDVWAFMDSINGQILTDENVTKDNEGKYRYYNTQYWVPDHTYYFVALAPMDSANVVEHFATGDATPGLVSLEYTNVDGTEDLLYASAKVAATDNQSAVNFQFRHLLSKVKFSFKNGFVNENYTITVRNIKMTAPKQADLEFNTTEYVWKNLNDEIILDFGSTEDIEAGQTLSSANQCLTIPAGDDQVYNVTFDVELSVVGNSAKTYSKKIELHSIDLEAGKAYNFVAEIDADNLQLGDIDFNASVKPWDEDQQTPSYSPYCVEVAGESYDNLKDAIAAAVENNAEVKFFQNVYVDADTALTISAGTSVTLDLNGYSIIAESNETGTNRNLFNVRGELTVKNGTLILEHDSEKNMGWSNSTNLFHVEAATLNLDGVTAKNLGGSDMAFVAHLNNWGNSASNLNIENSTLESTYIPVRLFNSGPQMNNVFIANSTLKGASYALWVHNYTVADFGSEAKAAAQQALVNLDIFDNDNKFSPDLNGIRLGFTDAAKADAYGIIKTVSADGTEVTLGSLTDDGLVRRGVAGDEENTTIKKAVVGEGVTVLYDRTFRRFYALETVELPSTLTTIGAAGSGVFQSCTKLKNIVIPESVTVLGKGTFQECSSLESINIPAGVTRIEADCLRSTGLKSVEFHEGVTYFGAQAFRDCKQLEKVVINAPQFTVEPNAFGVMSGPLPGTTIYVANAEMKAYLEATLSFKNQFTIVAPGVVTSADELKDKMLAGERVMLGSDIVLPSAIYFNNSDKEIYLDGNGHTITMADDATNSTALFDIEGGKATIKNVVFDGIKNGAVVRTVDTDFVADNVTSQNCTHSVGEGLFRLRGKNTVKNSTFKNNTSSQGLILTFNFDGANPELPQVLENCVFEGNTANSSAIVYYVKGSSCTINGNKFVGNTVNCNNNGATLYMGFQENCVVTNNLFKNNTVNESNTSSRVAGGVFFGYDTVFTGNAFVGNTVTGENAVAKDVCVSTYYTSIDLSGNYWGGNAPVEDINYFVQHKSDERTVIVDSYLTENPIE